MRPCLWLQAYHLQMYPNPEPPPTSPRQQHLHHRPFPVNHHLKSPLWKSTTQIPTPWPWHKQWASPPSANSTPPKSAATTPNLTPLSPSPQHHLAKQTQRLRLVRTRHLLGLRALLLPLLRSTMTRSPSKTTTTTMTRRTETLDHRTSCRNPSQAFPPVPPFQDPGPPSTTQNKITDTLNSSNILADTTIRSGTKGTTILPLTPTHGSASRRSLIFPHAMSGPNVRHPPLPNSSLWIT